MTYRIVPIAPEHIESFRETIDAVLRESQMFALFEAPPVQEFTHFVLGTIEKGDSQFIAIDEQRVIGWCDVLIKPRPAMRHTGTFGIGVLSTHRQQGLGTALAERTLAAARERGLTRIELFVRTDNERARRLYEKLGFTVEGVLRKHLLAGGTYRDSYLMALLYE